MSAPRVGDGGVPLAIDASSRGVLVLNPEGTIVLVNRDVERQFGYRRRARRASSTCSRRTLPAVHAASQDASGGGPDAGAIGPTLEVVARHKDGSETPVEIRVRPLRTAEGAFVLAPAASPSDQSPADWQQTLQEQLEFERFVAELSGQFINVPVEQFADATREGLRRVCEHVNLDRSVCYTIDAGGVPAEFATWVGPGVPVADTGADPLSLGDRAGPGRPDGGVLHLADVPDDVDRESYEAMGVKSARQDAAVGGGPRRRCGQLPRGAGRADVDPGGHASARGDRQRVRRNPRPAAARRGSLGGRPSKRNG